MDIVNQINSIGGANFSGFVLFLKIISGLTSASFIIGSIYSYLGLKKVQENENIKRMQHFSLGDNQTTRKNLIQERWQSIVTMFQSSDSTAWRMAIIDADAMMEDLVDSIGFKGENFGEKLKQMQQSRVPWIQSAWDVHLLRNKLAHEGSRYPLNNREAYQAFKVYESIFQNTGYLA